MAEIQVKLEARRVHLVEEMESLGDGLDVHARFGFDHERDVIVVTQSAQALMNTVDEQGARIYRGAGDVFSPDEAASECNQGNAELAGEVDAARDQVDAPLPACEVRAHQGGLVRPGRRKEMRGGCDTGRLDRDGRKFPPYGGDVLVGQVKWIELISVEGKLDTRKTCLIDRTN